MQHHPCQPDHPLQHVIVDKGSTVKKPAADAEILKNNKHTMQEVTQIRQTALSILCLGFRASYINIYKENQLDAV